MTTVAQQYTSKWRPIIEPIAAKYGINPDFVLTQIAQESQWGKHSPTGSNNYAGITDPRKKSDGVMAHDAGNLRKFRKFGSEQEFAEYYVDMLSRLYPGTKTAKNIQEFAAALQDGKRRYAESPRYKQDLQQVYNSHYANQPGSISQQSMVPQTTSPVVTSAGVGLADYAAAQVAAGNPIKLDLAKIPDEKDPYADLWNLKPPTEQKRPAQVALHDGRSPYKGGDFKYKWGLS